MARKRDREGVREREREKIDRFDPCLIPNFFFTVNLFIKFKNQQGWQHLQKWHNKLWYQIVTGIL